MVPFYSVTSFFSLLFPVAAPYLDTVRDCYEVSRLVFSPFKRSFSRFHVSNSPFTSLSLSLYFSVSLSLSLSLFLRLSLSLSLSLSISPSLSLSLPLSLLDHRKKAWVIYNFLSLCLAYVGGAGRVEVAMAGFVLTPSLAHCTCCLAPAPVDGAFVRRCKRGTLQFVLLKPVLAAATVALHHEGKFREGSWAADSGYLWVTLVYNFTYSWALFSLLLFYMGTRDLLRPHRPVLKFVCVKSVVFATFWQGVAVGVAVGVGALPGPAAGKAMQNLLLCCEMLPAAVAMAFAFPWREYAGAGAAGAGCFGWRGGKGGIDAAAFSSGAAARAAVSGGGAAAGTGGGGGGVDLTSMRHAISIRDVVADTVHQFAPAYHNYVLYDSGGSGGGGGGGVGGGGSGSPAESGGGGKRGSSSGGGTPRTVRAQTFIAVGRETASGIGSKGGAASSPRQGGGGNAAAAAAASSTTAAGASNKSAAADSAPAPKNPFTIDEEDALDDDDEEARYRRDNHAAGDEEAGPLAPSSSSRQRAPDLSVAVAPRGALQREASDGLVLDSPLAVAAAAGGSSSSSSVPAVPPPAVAGGGTTSAARPPPPPQQRQQPGFDSVDLR